MERMMSANFSVEQSLIKAKSHTKKGELVEAQKLFQAVLIAFPKNIRAQQGLATLNKNNITQSPPQEAVDQLVNLYNQGQIASVIEQAEVLTDQYPGAAVVWNILGASRAQVGKLDEAIDAYKKTISLKPGYADAYFNMGIVLKDQGKFEEAIEAYKKSITLKPDHAEAYCNKGSVLYDQGKFDEAIEAYKKSILLKPNYADAYNNMGLALHYQDKMEEAIQAYNKTLSLNPDYAEAHHNLSFALLKSGRLKEGLEESEWRWKNPEFSSLQRSFLQPMWDGTQSLKGKKILVWGEQGVGDTLIWSSCLSLITSQAKQYILECQEKLLPLLKRSFPNVDVRHENRNLDLVRDDFDFHLPMGSLYKHFIDEITQNTPLDAYLIPDPVRVNYWKERLKSIGKGPYVGIGWKSSNMSPERLPNYSSISEWSSILTIPDVTFINLQYKDFKDDLAKVKDELGVTVHNFDDLDQFNNIDDVAALCTALDMVVSNHGTLPLISGGVGAPTKLANWRQSPWNTILNNPVGPSIHIFERDTWEPWDNIFKSIKEDITKLTKNWSF
jgi:tetratricopeptide (TPR) repeat protein